MTFFRKRSAKVRVGSFGCNFGKKFHIRAALPNFLRFGIGFLK